MRNKPQIKTLYQALDCRLNAIDDADKELALILDMRGWKILDISINTLPNPRSDNCEYKTIRVVTLRRF